MRVNSSPSSLIGPGASPHVSASLPPQEHPQKPWQMLPSGSPRRGFPPGMEVPLEPQVSPGTISGGSLAHLPVGGPAFLQLVLHGGVLISSPSEFYFPYC